MNTTPADIVRLCNAYMAADHAMRNAGGTPAAHRICERAHEEQTAGLAALGADIMLQWGDPALGYRLCAVEVEVGGERHVIGRKPAWAIAAEAETEAAAAAARARRAAVEASRLAHLGMTLDEVRAAMGARAMREAWELDRCVTAATYRVKCVRRDGDGAAQWATALDGYCDESAAYCIAVQGVSGKESARARWAGQIDALTQIANLYELAALGGR